MSIADELSKLGQLKEQGLIDQAEFDKQKADLLGASDKRIKTKGLWWKLIIAAAALAALIASLSANFNKGIASLPACGSDQAKSTLTGAFNQSQFARVMKLSAVEITEAAERSFDAKASVRTCTAKVSMNNLTTANVNFKLEGRPDGQYLLTFEVVEEQAMKTPTATSVEAPVAASVAVAASAPDDETAGKVTVTRFGPVKVTEDLHVLFQGKPLTPPLDGGNSLDVIQKFEIGADDVLLLQETGGTACPALFYFVRVNASGASAATGSSFGSCSDLIKVTRSADTVRVTMPGYAGSFQPKAEQETAVAEEHTFVYRNGAVNEETHAKAAAATQAEPSFSCSGKLSPAERLICDTPTLSDADAKLGRLYAAALSEAADQAALKQQQRDWRRARDACGDVACMNDAYSKRSAELAH